MKNLGNSIIVGRLDKGLVFSLVMEGLTNIQVDIPCTYIINFVIHKMKVG